MRIGILSDTHDHIENTRRALELLRQEQVERLFHCGDVTSPEVVSLFEGWDVLFVRGNLDRLNALEPAVVALGRQPFLGDELSTTVAGRRILILHGDDTERLNQAIASGEFDYIFHGHTHRRRDERIGRTRIINPGALGGVRHESRSFCILDLETDELRFIEVEP
ncbi:metallophosphoesterase [Thermoflexus sp.]|uniref:metallophosphoesterase family protein n=1 Tax=Thermoflexus sp. TaxID=1969742 RepID=UPI001757949C|nr:metallophosphoesterase [Thermoflexus sp.]